MNQNHKMQYGFFNVNLCYCMHCMYMIGPWIFKFEQQRTCLINIPAMHVMKTACIPVRVTRKAI